MLSEPVAIEIIGGAAALLAYGAQSPTKDIGSLGPIDERILRVAALAPHKIPLDRAAVVDPPWNYEDRRLRLPLPFRKLEVVVSERHDLLLMKALRAYNTTRFALARRTCYGQPRSRTPCATALTTLCT